MYPELHNATALLVLYYYHRKQRGKQSWYATTNIFEEINKGSLKKKGRIWELVPT